LADAPELRASAAGAAPTPVRLTVAVPVSAGIANGASLTGPESELRVTVTESPGAGELGDNESDMLPGSNADTDPDPKDDDESLAYSLHVNVAEPPARAGRSATARTDATKLSDATAATQRRRPDQPATLGCARCRPSERRLTA
jgi:hypothetical protein